MRVLEIGTRKHTEVIAIDEKGQGNANHEYQIVGSAPIPPDNVSGKILGKISFQNGPIKEFGVNGIHNEDLIAIVIDRLDGFQSGDFACEDNAVAKCLLEKALSQLKKRTDEREARGVEGTHTV